MLAICSTPPNGLTAVLWPNAGAVALRAATKCMAIDGIVAQGGLAVPAESTMHLDDLPDRWYSDAPTSEESTRISM
jgi:hypothetical protein